MLWLAFALVLINRMEVFLGIMAKANEKLEQEVKLVELVSFD